MFLTNQNLKLGTKLAGAFTVYGLRNLDQGKIIIITQTTIC